MLKTKLIIWATIIIAIIAWIFFLGRPISNWVDLSLTKLGFSALIIQLILLALPLVLLVVLLLEGVIKLLLLSVVTPLKIISTQPELWQHLDREQLARYTTELEQLGFIRLTDFTVPPFLGMARLFVHPQRFCFAEVIHSKELSMVCSIVCHLEKDWSLATTNIPVSDNGSAVSYAFLRQPRMLFKQVENAPSDLLFQSLLDWRERASRDLGVEPIRDISAEMYFEKERNKRRKQRRYLLGKSIIWGLLEMKWFSSHPQSEWLGDYAKFKAKRR